MPCPACLFSRPVKIQVILHYQKLIEKEISPAIDSRRKARENPIFHGLLYLGRRVPLLIETVLVAI